MTDSDSLVALVPIWELHRKRILTCGDILHGLLPDSDPPVTLHRRDLRPYDEGVGVHFQRTLTGDLYAGTVVSACFVAQIELVAATDIIVTVDAAPLLEYRDGHVEVVGRRRAWMAIGDERKLWRLFAYSLTQAATQVFTQVRAGEPLEEIIAGFAGHVPTP